MEGGRAWFIAGFFFLGRVFFLRKEDGANGSLVRSPTGISPRLLFSRRPRPRGDT